MCHQEDHTHGEESVQIEQHGGFAAPLIVWGYGFLSITVISAVSLMGIMTVPLTRRYPKLYKRVLSYLVALAVGSLSGDALLHLIPHSFDSHDDGPSSHSLDPVYRGLIVLFGIYFFFMVERIMNLVNGRKKKRKNRRKFKGKFWISYQSESVGAKLNKHEERYNSLQYIQMITVHKGTGETHSYIQKPEKQDEEKCSQNHNHDDHHHSDHHHDTHQHSDHHPDGHHDRDEEAEENQGHHGHSHNHGDIKSQNIASVAWMVIMGDGLHNFSDGLAIGAAFAGSITAGLSTTIAVFCHELPHELGDFAILLSSGMRVKQAVMYSLVSSILAYIGMCIGVALGNIESMSSWLFALAGGMFLYIALVDMLPEMANAASTKDESQCCHLLLQNLGFLTGISIMLAIAMFEEDLLVALE
ncbi:zinc transporter ZIP10-like [Saccoglossus kowalevskii]